MSILSRFSNILSANINDLLDKAEDPAKMIDQYLRNLNNDLAEVKKETAAVMAEETRTKRLYDENAAEVARYAELAKKALLAGNDGDARVFLGKKQDVEAASANLQKAYDAARENASKMRQMHDKLVSDINSLNARRQSIKATVAVARTQERISKISGGQSERAMGAFDRMEDKASQMLDRANAMAELAAKPVDEAAELEKKYASTQKAVAVDAELEALKKQLGIKPE